MISSVVKYVDFSGIGERLRELRKKLYSRKVMFVHIPKSGGTSLSHMLRAKYILSFAKVSEEASTLACAHLGKDEWFDFKRGLASYFAEQGTGYIQGHFCVDSHFLETYQNRYRFITLLRHPVDRFISHYYFDERYRSVPLKEFLKTPVAFSEAHVLCHFFGGLGWQSALDSDDIQLNIKSAVSNLEKFDVVGLLDYEDMFVHKCREKLNMSIGLPTRNVGKSRRAFAEAIDDEMLMQISELCADDMEIYQHFLNANSKLSDQEPAPVPSVFKTISEKS